LHVKVQALAAQAACPCETPVAHEWPQLPQLFASLVVSEHVEPQSVVAPEQPWTHSAFAPEASQIGVAPVQVVLHDPQ
jgi:hypothetical protein